MKRLLIAIGLILASVQAAVHTDATKDHSKYHVDVYLDVDSRETYTLLAALSFFNEQHQKKYDFSLKYKVNGKLQIEEKVEESNEELDKETKQEQLSQRISKSCYFNGEYCNESNPSAMREIIRQVCIARYSTEAFFAYAKSVGRQYNEYLKSQIQSIFEVSDLYPFDFDAASITALDQTTYGKDQMDRCFEDSFVAAKSEQEASPKKISYLSQNLILDKQLQIWESFKNADAQLPFVVLNHMEIYPAQGKKYKDQVIATMCAAVDDEENKNSSMCEGFIDQKEDTNDDNDSLSAGSIVLIILGGIMGALAIGYVAAKLYQRQIYKRKQDIFNYVHEYDKVDMILAHPYIELNSDEQKKDNKGSTPE